MKTVDSCPSFRTVIGIVGWSVPIRYFYNKNTFSISLLIANVLQTTYTEDIHFKFQKIFSLDIVLFSSLRYICYVNNDGFFLNYKEWILNFIRQYICFSTLQIVIVSFTNCFIWSTFLDVPNSSSLGPPYLMTWNIS